MEEITDHRRFRLNRFDDCEEHERFRMVLFQELLVQTMSANVENFVMRFGTCSHGPFEQIRR